MLSELLIISNISKLPYKSKGRNDHAIIFHDVKLYQFLSILAIKEINFNKLKGLERFLFKILNPVSLK